MDFVKLFEMQKKLEAHIVESKGLEGKNLLQEKILSLQVELGELANELRFFKVWSSDQRPRMKVVRVPAMMEEDKVYYNPVLEELVDGWHFILSIGLDLKVEKINISTIILDSLTAQFNGLFNAISTLAVGFYHNYDQVVSAYLGLGEMLGFTWKQIEEAYFAKNAINHHRQEVGY